MESKADSMASTPTLTRSEEGHQKLAADSVRRSSTISKPPSTHSTHSKSSKDVKATDKGPAPAGPGLQAPIDVPRWRFWAIFISVMLSIFLFALDQLILATATPAIVSDFGALSSLAWMANGFFLTLLGFNLIYSQWNQIFPSKVVLIFAIFIFELGSLVCAVSNSMVVLILGRAITGVGASGLFSGGMIIIAELTPLHNRAQYLGLMGAVFAVASVLGPLIGGAFTDHVSWRWCFYINLPFGGLAIACIALFQPLAPPLGRAATYKGFHRGMIWDVLRCDWVGCGLSMAWAVVLILWLQWGGQEKKWSDGGVITCIVLSIVLIPIFIAYEYWMGERAMFKLALLKRRTISGASILLFWLFGLFMAEVYYISVAFQSVYHISATGAGVRLLPFVMTQIVVLMASSRIVPKIGRFKYVILAGPVFLALGSILLYTVKYGTSISHLMGFEVFLGIGIGLSMQNTMLAVQFELKKEPHLISAGTGLSVFIGFGGRILGLSLAGNIFGNMLKVNLRKYASDLPATLFDAVVSSSDSIWTAVPENLRPGVLKAYAESLRLIYILGLPMACLAVVGGLLIKNSKMQTKEEEMQAIQAAKEKAALAQGEKTGGEGSSKDAVQAGDAERFAEDITVVAPQPVVSDPRVVLDKSEGKSPV